MYYNCAKNFVFFYSADCTALDSPIFVNFFIEIFYFSDIDRLKPFTDDPQKENLLN